jgi:hypothetical protein
VPLLLKQGIIFNRNFKGKFCCYSFYLTANAVFIVINLLSGITNNKFANEDLFFSFAAVKGD